MDDDMRELVNKAYWDRQAELVTIAIIQDLPPWPFREMRCECCGQVVDQLEPDRDGFYICPVCIDERVQLDESFLGIGHDQDYDDELNAEAEDARWAMYEGAYGDERGA